MSFFDKFLPKHTSTPDSKDVAPAKPSTLERGTPRWKETVALGAAAFSLIACSPEQNAAEAPAPVTVTVIPEAVASASTPIPITSESETYSIPVTEVVSPITTPTESTAPETTTSDAITTVPSSEVAPETTESDTPLGVTLELPPLSAAEYENSLDTLGDAIVNDSLSTWANASCDEQTKQTILDKVAAGGDQEEIVLAVATANRDAAVEQLFGKDISELDDDSLAFANFLRDLNYEGLYHYLDTADSTDGYQPFEQSFKSNGSEVLYKEDPSAPDKIGVNALLSSNVRDTTLSHNPNVRGASVEGFTFVVNNEGGTYHIVSAYHQADTSGTIGG